MRAEVHEYGAITLHVKNAAKTVLVMRYKVIPLVDLDRFLDDGDIEGTSRQVAPSGAGARWLHYSHSTRMACDAAAYGRRQGASALTPACC